MPITLQWRGRIGSAELSALHAAGFGHPLVLGDWQAQLDRHSLGWACARAGTELAGFVNVAWDGASHAFVLDTVVDERYRRRGVGTALVTMAVREARLAGCAWLHVDFEDRLRDFYLRACGFVPTAAGLIPLQPSG